MRFVVNYKQWNATDREREEALFVFAYWRELIELLGDVSSFFYTMTMTMTKWQRKWKLECDNVTKWEAECSWKCRECQLEVQQRGRISDSAPLHFNQRVLDSSSLLGAHNGVETKFGVLKEGQLAPFHQLWVCGSAVSSPNRVRQRVFLYSVQSDCLSQHLSTCCIQFAWLGIRGVRTDICDIWVIVTTLV